MKPIIIEVPNAKAAVVYNIAYQVEKVIHGPAKFEYAFGEKTYDVEIMSNRRADFLLEYKPAQKSKLSRFIDKLRNLVA